MSTTINDVARKAGVSHTTVSWVIHDDPRITDKTKAKVWAAIKELNYHPNLNARNLVRGKTNTIALVAGLFSTPFEIEFLKGVESAFLDKNGKYGITLYSLMGRLDKKIETIKEILHGKRADAVIIVNLTINEDLIREFKDKKIPVILVEEDAHDIHVLKMDNTAGAELAVESLIESGRKRIALVVGDPNDPDSSLSPRERIAGYRNALKRHSIEPSEELILESDEYYFEKGPMIFDSLMERAPDLDAIFCASGDILALGIMQRALELGKSVPGDIAIIGYDNIYVSEMANPPLSSVGQPIELMGRDAIETAVAALDENIPPAVKLYQPALIRRKSS